MRTKWTHRGVTNSNKPTIQQLLITAIDNNYFDSLDLFLKQFGEPTNPQHTSNDSLDILIDTMDKKEKSYKAKYAISSGNIDLTTAKQIIFEYPEILRCMTDNFDSFLKTMHEGEVTDKTDLLLAGTFLQAASHIINDIIHYNSKGFPKHILANEALHSLAEHIGTAETERKNKLLTPHTINVACGTGPLDTSWSSKMQPSHKRARSM